MADSFDYMLLGLFVGREGTPSFSTEVDFDMGNRWARYAFEAGRASARKAKKAVAAKDEIAKMPLLGQETIPDYGLETAAAEEVDLDVAWSNSHPT
jgi:hypothetical protein